MSTPTTMEHVFEQLNNVCDQIDKHAKVHEKLACAEILLSSTTIMLCDMLEGQSIPPEEIVSRLSKLREFLYDPEKTHHFPAPRLSQ